MRSGLVVVVPASLPEAPASLIACVKCQAPLEGAKFSPHLCGACGFPQPVSEAETPFTLLGAPVLFQQDEAALRARFYELSRALHPDRFAAAVPEARVYSIERMSRINEAYRLLRDRRLLRDAVLALFEVGEAVKTPGGSPQSQGLKGAPPVELAESWFELQDAVMDEPATAVEKIRDFEVGLEKKKAELSTQMGEQENVFDQSRAQDRVSLLEISRLLREQAYLESMARDVTRLRERWVASPVSARG
jgi:molecular chaperone HscB